VREELLQIADRTATFTHSRRREHQLRTANFSKDQCLAVLSHELRTPLTPALMLLDTVIASDECSKLPYQLFEDLATIRENLLVEGKLMDDLLDATRMGLGKFTISPTPANLHTIIRDAMKVVAYDANVKHLTIQAQLDASQQVIDADARRILQAIWNVCTRYALC